LNVPAGKKFQAAPELLLNQLRVLAFGGVRRILPIKQ
jgi:hypothetical protein